MIRNPFPPLPPSIVRLRKLDAYECIATKLDIRDFDSKKVPLDVKLKVLEAARLTGSGMNIQHWHYLMVQDPDSLKKLAEAATTGPWVAGANFAVVVFTDTQYGFHLIDAGRVAQDMQIAAWNFGVASGLYTGFDQKLLRKFFSIPENVSASIAIGFGYPTRKITGKKKRKPLRELVYLEKYGNPFDKEKLA